MANFKCKYYSTYLVEKYYFYSTVIIRYSNFNRRETYLYYLFESLNY